MARETVAVRLPADLIQELTAAAKKRGLTKTKLIEISIIHELNRNTESGGTYELKQLKKVIEKRINELEPAPVDTEIKTINYYVSEVEQLQAARGYVTREAVERISREAGLTFKEFLKLLHDDILIM